MTPIVEVPGVSTFWKIARLVSFLFSGRCQRATVQAHYKNKGADVVRAVLLLLGLQIYNL